MTPPLTDQEEVKELEQILEGGPGANSQLENIDNAGPDDQE